MNWSILPSLSQVRSAKMPRRVGSWSRRWIGITGNSCFTAQWSGIDWNTEKLP
jgi:hypothetical protein